MIYEYYTDGACTLKKTDKGYEKGPGGWAFALVENDEKKILEYKKGNFEKTTNNYCELYAIYSVFLHLTENKITNSTITIYSDSAYCVNMLKDNGWIYSWHNAGWKRKGGKNIENLSLVQYLYLEKEKLINSLNKIYFIKVQGHSQNIFNEYVDKLAVEAKKDVALGKIY